MKIGSKLQFEILDACPLGCPYNEEVFYQGCMCTRCPIFNCMPPITEEDKDYLPLIEPKGYRDDWAKEWEDFFKYGTQPKLIFAVKPIT